MLDVRVQIFSGIRVVRRGQNAAVAQRARAKLHAAMHPSDDLVLAELSYGRIDQLIGRQQIAKSQFAVFEYALDLFGGVAGPETQIAQRNARSLMVDPMPRLEHRT